jgi:protein phosphatase
LPVSAVSRWHPVQADAAARWRDPATGVTAYALADGIGQDGAVAEMAADAARTAARVATRAGPYAGILAARRAAAAVYTGAPAGQVDDAVLAVAVPMPARLGGGAVVAWTGDVRAYATRPGGHLEQVTVDRTRGQTYRRPGTPGWLRALADAHDNIVTTSVLTGQVDEVRILGPVHRLLLCTDGIHRRLTPPALAAALAGDVTPRTRRRTRRRR